MTNIQRPTKQQLRRMRLPQLWEAYHAIVGETTRAPNRVFLLRRIEEAMATPTARPATSTRKKGRTRTPQETPPTTAPSAAPGRPRGRFAAMTIPELQQRYLAVVGRPSQSRARNYLVWKIREAEAGRIHVGPSRSRRLAGEADAVKILPLRLEIGVIERMDAAWRTRGIASRMEFFRRALGHYLAHLGDGEAAAMFTSAG